MESGIIQLFPAFSGSTETTAEEMAAYVKEAAERFCALTGLAIIGDATVHHEYGAVYVLGEPGEGQGILAIGNHNNAAVYYRMMFISRVGVGNIVLVPYTAAGVISSNEGTSYNMQTNSISIYMKYIMDHDTVAFGLGTGITAATTYYCSYCMTTLKNGDMEKKAFLLHVNNSFYASYNSFLGNEVSNVVQFAVNNPYAPLVPAEKEAVADIYIQNSIQNVELPFAKLFTNKKGMAVWSVITINGERYMVMVKAAWTVLLKMKDPVSE